MCVGCDVVGRVAKSESEAMAGLVCVCVAVGEDGQSCWQLRSFYAIRPTEASMHDEQKKNKRPATKEISNHIASHFFVLLD